MSAPIGNEYYKLRQKDGRDKSFSPDDIWELWSEFVIWAKANPKHSFAVSMGATVKVPIERPLVLEEFYTWVDATKEATIHQYFNEKDERYKEYLGVVTRIKNHRFSDVAVGALAGIYNSAVSVRILGLAEKQEYDITTQGESLNKKLSPADAKKRLEELMGGKS